MLETALAWLGEAFAWATVASIVLGEATLWQAGRQQARSSRRS